MITIIRRTISLNKKSLLIYVLMCVFFTWMYVAIYPSVQKEAQNFTDLLNSYPKALMKAFGVEDTLFTHFETFFCMEYFSFLWPIVFFIFILFHASSTIAGEVENGTIEIILSQPISRLQVYIAKYISGFVLLTIFTVLSLGSVFPLAFIYNIDIQYFNYIIVMILCLLFGFCIFGMTMMFSAGASTKGKPLSYTAGILIIMYALNVVAGLQDSVEKIKYLSFFHYFDYTAALVHKHIGFETILIFGGIGIITSILGLIFFIKRDIVR